MPKRHETIPHGATGYDYAVLFGEYLQNARIIRIRDPYISTWPQIKNLERFLNTVRSCTKEMVYVRLETKIAQDNNISQQQLQKRRQEQQENLDKLTAMFIRQQLRFHWEYLPHFHDRHIIVDELRWKIVLGRGLDIHQSLTAEHVNLLRAGKITYRDIPCRDFSVTYIDDF